MPDIHQKLKDLSVTESARIFKMIRDARSTTFVKGTEMIGVSQESLRVILFNAMVDGASTFSKELKL